MSQASWDINANTVGLKKSYSIASNDYETPTHKSGFPSYLGPRPDDDAQTRGTDEGPYSAEEDKGDEEIGNDNTSTKEMSNNAKKNEGEVRRTEKDQGDAHIDRDGAEDEEEGLEAEEERERVQGRASELRTMDGVRKLAERRENLPFRGTTDARAKQQQVRASDRLNQVKPMALLTTPNKERRGSTESLLGKKRRKEDATMPAVQDKSQSNSDQNPSSDLRRDQEGTQGVEKHIEGPSASTHSRQQPMIMSPERFSGILKKADNNQGSSDKDNKPRTYRDPAKRQFREDCRDILDNIFKTMWDPKSQYISLENPLPSYRVVDHVIAAKNLEPVTDAIEDNEINHVLAAMLRVVNQVFLMRTIEVALAETPGSPLHAQSNVLRRIASHLQHRQVRRGKPPLSRTPAMLAAR